MLDLTLSELLVVVELRMLLLKMNLLQILERLELFLAEDVFLLVKGHDWAFLFLERAPRILQRLRLKQ